MALPELAHRRISPHAQVVQSLRKKSEVKIRVSDGFFDRRLDERPVSEPLSNRLGGTIEHRSEFEVAVRPGGRINEGARLGENVGHDEFDEPLGIRCFRFRPMAVSSARSQRPSSAGVPNAKARNRLPASPATQGLHWPSTQPTGRDHRPHHDRTVVEKSPQILGKGFRRFVPLVRLFLQALEADRLEVAG